MTPELKVCKKPECFTCFYMTRSKGTFLGIQMFQVVVDPIAHSLYKPYQKLCGHVCKQQKTYFFCRSRFSSLRFDLAMNVK